MSHDFTLIGLRVQVRIGHAETDLSAITGDLRGIAGDLSQIAGPLAMEDRWRL